MDPLVWHKVAGISGNICQFQAFALRFLFYFSSCALFNCVCNCTGMAALALGTYGAHMFKPKNPAYKEVTTYSVSSSIFVLNEIQIT